MPVSLVSVGFDTADPHGVASFWAGLLDRPMLVSGLGILLPGDATQVGLRFVAAANTPRPSRLHLHLTSSTRADQRRTVETVLALGGQHCDVGQRPEEDHIVMSDTDGNAFCVIGPGNAFLAGCGVLGEVTCEGSRNVGLFWRDALRWPLVWDQNGETAVQSPVGGTKISWGGETVRPGRARGRQRFELVASDVDVDVEVERLLALDAQLLSRSDDEVVLVDPDGHHFTLRPASGHFLQAR
jgi:hypothetical protein